LDLKCPWLKILNKGLKAPQMRLLRRVSRYKLSNHVGSETIREQRIEVTEKCRTQWIAQVKRMACLREGYNAELKTGVLGRQGGSAVNWP
jgi:hypothetical protein